MIGSRYFLKLALVLVAALLMAPGAFALERDLLEMEILVDGRPLREFAARNTTYIEALAGHEYSIRLRNRLGERVAVALSVDGLNSIDAKTTSAGDASKWILGPYQTMTIEGWQVSAADARRFFFTTEEKSYGAWLGKTTNLGVISAAAFRERRPRPAPIQRPSELRKERSRRDAPSSGPTAGRAQAGEAGARAEAESRKSMDSDDLAATGIGRKIDNRVRRVTFDAQRKPSAVLELRYEYRDALVRLGVFPEIDEPLARREGARGFEDLDFAPDPFDRRR